MPDKSISFRVTAILSLTIVLFASVFVIGMSQVPWGTLADADGYMRLVRVEWLYSTGQWYDTSVPRANAPHGGVLHWTRPLDVLLFSGAGVGAVAVTFKTALYAWGYVLGPVLMIAALAALWWASRPLASTM